MSIKSSKFSPQQLVFQELFVGTLIYAVVLGFFNDYTSFVYVNSFSTIFFASVILEILTYLVFQLKGTIIDWLKNRSGLIYLLIMFFCVWFVMFTSKFVFIWTLDLVFGSYININGFFGILFIVLSVTILHRLSLTIFKRL